MFHARHKHAMACFLLFQVSQFGRFHCLWFCASRLVLLAEENTGAFSLLFRIFLHTSGHTDEWSRERRVFAICDLLTYLLSSKGRVPLSKRNAFALQLEKAPWSASNHNVILLLKNGREEFEAYTIYPWHYLPLVYVKLCRNALCLAIPTACENFLRRFLRAFLLYSRLKQQETFVFYYSAVPPIRRIQTDGTIPLAHTTHTAPCHRSFPLMPVMTGESWIQLLIWTYWKHCYSWCLAGSFLHHTFGSDIFFHCIMLFWKWYKERKRIEDNESHTIFCGWDGKAGIFSLPPSCHHHYHLPATEWESLFLPKCLYHHHPIYLLHTM